MAATAVLMATLRSSQHGQEKESSFCLSTDKARLNNFIYTMAYNVSM